MKQTLSLILTVGTGTAGADSFVAQGLRTTVEILQPRRFWLLPSISAASIEVADYVREGLDTFAPWSAEAAYRLFEEPDSLQACRTVVREVIQVARSELGPMERLLVNPTSGTKQMSSGATIAALDEKIGELVFTVGERSDGVVKTGTERLESFHADSYFAERDFQLARDLFNTGSFAAAASLLRPYPAIRAERELCALIHEWERSNYAGAFEIAKSGHHPAFPNLLNHLKPLTAEASRGGRPSAYVTADLLNLAKRLFERREHEASLLTACKALEVGLRYDFLQRTGLYEPYRLSDLESLPGISLAKFNRLRANTQPDGTLFLGLRALGDLLHTQASPLAEVYQNKREIKDVVRIRNDRTHQIRAVTRAEANLAIREIRALLAPLHLPVAADLPSTLEYAASSC